MNVYKVTIPGTVRIDYECAVIAKDPETALKEVYTCLKQGNEPGEFNESSVNEYNPTLDPWKKSKISVEPFFKSLSTP